jgi:hypothetical protein
VSGKVCSLVEETVVTLNFYAEVSESDTETGDRWNKSDKAQMWYDF